MKKWPDGPSPAQVAKDTVENPPARGAGLSRLRAAPGAEAIRQRTLIEQGAARDKVRAQADAGALPVTKGCRVRDAAGQRGTVVLCDVVVAGLVAGTLHGHVVRWASGTCEWVRRAHLTVLP